MIQQNYPGYSQPGGLYSPQPLMDNLSQMRAQYMPPAPPQPAPQPQSSVIWVQGEAGAKAYMVAAGNNVLLLDSDSPVFYIKSTDASGMPLPLRIFDYTERAQQNKAAPAAQAPQPEYVTRQEFEAAIERLTPQKKTRKTQSEEMTTDE